MNARKNRLDQLRAEQSEIGNHVIDEFVAGRLNRRDFLRTGALVGISAPILGGVLAACGPQALTRASNSSAERPLFTVDGMVPFRRPRYLGWSAAYFSVDSCFLRSR